MKPSEPTQALPHETTEYGGRQYDVAMLARYAETFPIETVALSAFAAWLGSTHAYWDDREGKPLGPAQILQSWESAQNNPAWADHVRTIKNADLSEPIWAMRQDGRVINGMHRLVRATLENQEFVLVRYFSRLPEIA